MPAAERCTVPLPADSPVQHVDAHVWAGERADRPVVVLAHGAGSRLDHPLHQRVCGAVAAAGLTTVAFNFAYAQLGRRSPDPMPRVLRCYEAALEWVRGRFPGRAIVAGGRSMGGRAASLLAAEGAALGGLVLLNYPLLPANRRPDSRPRIDHWPAITVPVLFVHGTRDRLIPGEELSRHLGALSGTDVTVHVVADADHGFAVPQRSGRDGADVAAEVGGAVAAWVARKVAA